MFDLRQLVRDVADTSDAVDPDTLAKEVLVLIPADHRDEALRQAMGTVVQHVISRSRHISFPGDQTLHDTHPRPAAGGYSNAKVTGIREAWHRVLESRIAVAPKQWKRIADCGIHDLKAAAAIRMEHARRNTANAETLLRIARLVGEHGVGTVGQLPDSVLTAALAGVQ